MLHSVLLLLLFFYWGKTYTFGHIFMVGRDPKGETLFWGNNIISTFFCSILGRMQWLQSPTCSRYLQHWQITTPLTSLAHLPTQGHLVKSLDGRKNYSSAESCHASFGAILGTRGLRVCAHCSLQAASSRSRLVEQRNADVMPPNSCKTALAAHNSTSQMLMFCQRRLLLEYAGTF